MFDIILSNLEFVMYGELIFLASYISNVCFSLYYNIKVLKQTFDKSKLLNSGCKVLSFLLGTCLLSMVITTLPIFADHVGFTIPSEYMIVFSDLVIIGVFITASAKYAIESFNKMKAILEQSSSSIEG